MPPTHPIADETLLRLVDGELAAGESSEIERHLTACEPCRARLQLVRAAASEADRLCTDVSSPAADLDAVRARVRANIAHIASDEDRSWTLRLDTLTAAVPIAALAIAAMLLLAAAAGLWRSPFALFRTAPQAADAGEIGVLPIPAFTPGAVEPIALDVMCAGRAPQRQPIAAPIRLAVLRDYGMEHVADEEYELDYLITPELGGSSDRRNLWPERYASRVWNARVKDELERLLPQMVCEGRLDLATAQHDIASNWIAAYQKYFGTDRPLGSGARRASPVLLAARFSPPAGR
jgi:anti-sigma factor RsiW